MGLTKFLVNVFKDNDEAIAKVAHALGMSKGWESVCTDVR